MSMIVTNANLHGKHPPEDSLGHDALAEKLFGNVGYSPRGTVFALQASWGSGKTDLLLRLSKVAQKKKFLILWINPWQYGTPDLLSPLALALLRLVAPGRRKGLKKAALTIANSGIQIGGKMVGSYLGGASGIDTVIEKQITDLLKATKDEDMPDVDPVAHMAERFGELVNAAVEHNIAKDGRAGLLVCIDDLDRCLPDRQVALLEAYRFLTLTDAPVWFAVAIDPILAREAVLARFDTKAFDPDRYLDKMFDFRFNLPALDDARTSQFIRNCLDWRIQTITDNPTIAAVLAAVFQTKDDASVVRNADAAFRHVEFRNPRVIARVLYKARLWAIAKPEVAFPAELKGEHRLTAVLLYLCMCERWPIVRVALQDAGAEFEKRFEAIIDYYSVGAEGTKPAKDASLLLAGEYAILKSLPSPERDHVLRQFMHTCDGTLLGGRPMLAKAFRAIDVAMVSVGL